MTSTPQQFGATADDGTDDRHAFAALEADVNSLAGRVPAGTYRIASDLTLSKHWTFELGAKLRPDTGVTIKFTGSVAAGLYHWIDTSSSDMSARGTVAFTRTVDLHPEWWGAKGGGLTTDSAGNVTRDGAGNVITVGEDDTEALLAMRATLRALNGTGSIPVVRFQPGHYVYTRNDWLRGVLNVHILAHGAKFQNIKFGGYSATLQPFRPNLHMTQEVAEIYGSPAYPKTAPSYDIATVAAGATTVQLLPVEGDDFVDRMTTEDGFAPGKRMLLMGRTQQRSTNPPNPRYTDWLTIHSVNKSNGIITFTRPLRHSYRQDWWEDVFSNFGPAKLISLDRPNFTLGYRCVIEGAEFLGNPNVTEPYGETVYAEGYEDFQYIDCRMPRFLPSCARVITMRNCEVTGESEADKLIEHLVIEDTRMDGTLQEASGVELLTIRRGRMAGGADLRPHRLDMEGVEITTPVNGQTFGIRISNAYGTRHASIRRCRFNTTAAGALGIAGPPPGNITVGQVEAPVGGMFVFSVIRQNGGTIADPIPDTNMDVVNMLLEGARARGTNGSLLVRACWADDTKFYVQGDLTGSIAAGDVLSYSILNSLELEDNEVIGPGRLMHGGNVETLSRDTRVSPHVITLGHQPWTGALEFHDAGGQIEKIIVNVGRPYAGSSVGLMGIQGSRFQNGSQFRSAVVQINTRIAGMRVLEFGDTAIRGAKTGDVMHTSLHSAPAFDQFRIDHDSVAPEFTDTRDLLANVTIHVTVVPRA